QKNMHFREFSIIQIIKTALHMFITIILILFGFGIFGYVYGTIISTLLYSILLIIITIMKTDFKITLHFKLKDIKSFLNFGVSISAKRIITFISQRIDEIIIGGALSSEVLGVYYFGKRLIIQLQGVLTKSFAQLLLPLFSKLKKDRMKLKSAYIKLSFSVAIIGFPVFIGVVLTANLFVPLFFGE